MEAPTPASFKSGGYSAINSLVSPLHKAIRKAQGDERSETSVLYVRKHWGASEQVERATPTPSAKTLDGLCGYGATAPDPRRGNDAIAVATARRSNDGDGAVPS